MAEMVITRELTDNRFTLTVDIQNLTNAELELVDDFGEPSVTFGGTIDITDTDLFELGYTPVSSAAFTVASTTRNIPSSFPFSITLDKDSITEAENNLADYQNHIEHKITLAWAALKALSDTWTVGSPEVITLA